MGLSSRLKKSHTTSFFEISQRGIFAKFGYFPKDFLLKMAFFREIFRDGKYRKKVVMEEIMHTTLPPTNSDSFTRRQQNLTYCIPVTCLKRASHSCHISMAGNQY